MKMEAAQIKGARKREERNRIKNIHIHTHTYLYINDTCMKLK
jgi:hypothetical protein